MVAITREAAAATMRVPVLLHARAESDKDRDREKTRKSFVVIAIIVIAILTILAATYLLTIRFRKRDKRSSPQKAKQDKLPSLFKWPWQKKNRPRRNEYSTSLQGNELEGHASRQESMSGATQDPERQQDVSGVDRNTSVRSVMTLPPYSVAARENERILGREGERDGIDIIVEAPETQDEEEARREAEMDSLYQIRLARRNEAREREERRQARREARERNDQQAMQALRRRAEAVAEESLSQMLIAEHQSTNRERRVSSVQYGDLGVARHDGTRLRANSTESDHRPLLDSAASISGQSARSRAASHTALTPSHVRGPSVSSIISISSRGSDEFEFPEAVHTRSNDTSDDFEVVTLSHPHSRSASRIATPIPSPSIEIPREQAPAYEDPPTYESPLQTRAPQLPTIERLPSIRVTPDQPPANERSANPR